MGTRLVAHTMCSFTPYSEKEPHLIRHSLASLVRQKVLQIACGYEDQNDSNS